MSAAIIDFLLMLAIGGLAGLVIALHIRMRQFMRQAQSVPALADDLTQAITASKSAIQGLQKACKTDGVQLEELLLKVERTRQEILFILDRAEKLAVQLENPAGGFTNGVTNSMDADTAARDTAVIQKTVQEQGAVQIQSGEGVAPPNSTVAAIRQSSAGPSAQPSVQSPTEVAPVIGQPVERLETQDEVTQRIRTQSTQKTAPYRPATFAHSASAYRGADVFSAQKPQDDHEQELRRALENL